MLIPLCHDMKHRLSAAACQFLEHPHGVLAGSSGAQRPAGVPVATDRAFQFKQPVVIQLPFSAVGADASWTVRFLAVSLFVTAWQRILSSGGFWGVIGRHGSSCNRRVQVQMDSLRGMTVLLLYATLRNLQLRICLLA